ncbi:MAG: rhodanese-like domain-containing protein [Arenicellales bacterium]|nr:rhodanese-like domain-containing protein [Arenicellales bacterium]
MFISTVKRSTFVVFALVFGICTTTLAADSIKGSELAARIKNGETPSLILDVRTREEFAQSHIPGAVNIPVMDLMSRGTQLKPYKEKEIVVYCEVGPRAGFAEYMLLQNGFTLVRNLEGHMQQWLADGHPVEKQ